MKLLVSKCCNVTRVSCPEVDGSTYFAIICGLPASFVRTPASWQVSSLRNNWWFGGWAPTSLPISQQFHVSRCLEPQPETLCSLWLATLSSASGIEVKLDISYNSDFLHSLFLTRPLSRQSWREMSPTDHTPLTN